MCTHRPKHESLPRDPSMLWIESPGSVGTRERLLARQLPSRSQLQRPLELLIEVGALPTEEEGKPRLAPLLPLQGHGLSPCARVCV